MSEDLRIAKLVEGRQCIVSPRLATALNSWDKAHILGRIHFWSNYNAQRQLKNAFQDGHFWMYMTYFELCEDVGGIQFATMRRRVKELEEAGLLISGYYNTRRGDNTKWYRIDYVALNQLLDQQPTPPTKTPNRTTEDSPIEPNEQKYFELEVASILKNGSNFDEKSDVGSNNVDGGSLMFVGGSVQVESSITSIANSLEKSIANSKKNTKGFALKQGSPNFLQNNTGDEHQSEVVQTPKYTNNEETEGQKSLWGETISVSKTTPNTSRVIKAEPSPDALNLISYTKSLHPKNHFWQGCTAEWFDQQLKIWGKRKLTAGVYEAHYRNTNHTAKGILAALQWLDINKFDLEGNRIPDSELPQIAKQPTTQPNNNHQAGSSSNVISTGRIITAVKKETDSDEGQTKTVYEVTVVGPGKGIPAVEGEAKTKAGTKLYSDDLPLALRPKAGGPPVYVASDYMLPGHNLTLSDKPIAINDPLPKEVQPTDPSKNLPLKVNPYVYHDNFDPEMPLPTEPERWLPINRKKRVRQTGTNRLYELDLREDDLYKVIMGLQTAQTQDPWSVQKLYNAFYNWDKNVLDRTIWRCEETKRLGGVDPYAGVKEEAYERLETELANIRRVATLVKKHY